MGNSVEREEQKLKFIQTIDDRHFGEVDIYRCQDGKFVMRNKRTHITGDKRYDEFQKVIQFVSNNNSQTIVPVIHMIQQYEKNICIEYQITYIYTEYFNYTLLDLIQSNKEIEESELCYLMQTLLELVLLLKNHHLGINLSPDNIFLTLKGFPAVYLYHILPFEQYVSTNEQGMAQQVGRIILQMATNQPDNNQIKNNDLMGQLSKLFQHYKIIGKLVKELVNRERNESSALQQIKNIYRMNRIKKVTEIKLNKFRYILPQQIVQEKENNIVQKPVEFKPTRRQSQGNKVNISQKLPTETVPSLQMIMNTQQKVRNEASRSSTVKTQHLSSTKFDLQDYNRQDVAKLLSNLGKKKEQNEKQKEKLKQKKEQFLHHDKENQIENAVTILKEINKHNPRKGSEIRKSKNR